MPVNKVEHALWIAPQPVSLDTPIGEDGDATLGDLIEDRNTIAPLDSVVSAKLGEATRRALATLTPREERILRMRLGIGMPSDHTLEKIGQEFKLTRERIRQIEAKALAKLKRDPRARHLRSFLEE